MPASHPTSRLCSVEGCARSALARGWCNMHYHRWLRHGNPQAVTFIRGDLAANFWLHVCQDGPILAVCPELGPCWIWTGSRVPDGYGQLTWDGKQRPAHVVSWFLAHGLWPGSLHTLHRCDLPSCVNPSHLFLGTNADNAADRDRKGRQARGESNGHAKLTADQVRAIRAARLLGSTLAELAARHGVSLVAVHDVLSGRTWAHV